MVARANEFLAWLKGRPCLFWAFSAVKKKKKKNRSIRINWPTSCLVIIRQSASRPTCSPVYMCVRAMNVEQVAVVFYLEASHSRSTPLFLISLARWNWVEDPVLYEPVSVGFISMVMACGVLWKRLCSVNNTIARVGGVVNGSRYIVFGLQFHFGISDVFLF